MKYKIKQSGKSQKIIEFVISKEIVAGELDKVYKEISKVASLPGFRTGKAPLDIVRQRYQKEAREETIKNLLSDSFKKALNESDIDMLGLPEVSNLQFDKEKGMSYKATVSIRPQVKLKNYKGLSLNRTEKEIKESDVDSEINTLREMSAKYSGKEGSAKAGDYVICDMECVIEGHPAEKKENAWFYVGEDSFIPAKELEGLKINEEKDVEKLLPDNYSKKEIAGKKARFHIIVKEIKEKNLPELNDEFALTAGNFKNMTELREAVRENIKRRNKIEEKRELENQAMKILDKTAIFDVPQSMVDKHLEMLVNDAKERLKKQMVSEDEIKSMDKELRARLKDEALREVRAFFILGEIAKSEKIAVDDNEIDSVIAGIASSSGRSPKELKKYYIENELIENLREDIKQRKILEFVINQAKIS